MADESSPAKRAPHRRDKVRRAPAGVTERSSAPRTVVFALYDKVTLQDVAAPLEIFARANDFGARYQVLLVSLTGAGVGTTARSDFRHPTLKCSCVRDTAPLCSA